MCGIIAYIREREAQPLMVKVLKRLEYRSYDSCNIALNEAGGEVYSLHSAAWTTSHA